MRKLSYVLLFAVAAVMFACKSNPKDLIARKWVIDIEGLKKEAEKIEKKELSAEEEKLIKEMFKDTWFEFKKDGILEVSMLGQTVKGAWSLSDDGKKLKMKIEGEKEEGEIELVELTKTKMVGKGKNQTLVFKAAN